MDKPADREEQGIGETLCGFDPQWIDSRRCARVDLDEKDEPARRVLAAFGAIDEGCRREPGICHEAGRWTESLACQDQLRCASDPRSTWLDPLKDRLCAKRSAKREDSQPTARAVVRHQILQTLKSGHSYATMGLPTNDSNSDASDSIPQRESPRIRIASEELEIRW